MPLRQYPHNLTAAGSNGAIFSQDVEGEILCVYDSSASFLLYIDGETPLLVERGLKIRRKFSSYRVENISTAAMTVRIIAGTGDIDDFRPLTKPAGPVRGKTLYAAAIGAGGIVPATYPVCELADATRYEIGVQAPSTNTAAITLSSAQLAGTYIAVINPGQIVRFPFSGSVYIGGSIAADAATVWGTYY